MKDIEYETVALVLESWELSVSKLCRKLACVILDDDAHIISRAFRDDAATNLKKTLDVLWLTGKEIRAFS